MYVALACVLEHDIQERAVDGRHSIFIHKKKLNFLLQTAPVAVPVSAEPSHIDL